MMSIITTIIKLKETDFNLIKEDLSFAENAVVIFVPCKVITVGL